jgi:SPP1 gp7 family putative phage head morphogenesis protein
LPDQQPAIYETLVLSQLIGRYKAKRESDAKKNNSFAETIRESSLQWFDEYKLSDILTRALEWFRNKKIIQKDEFIALAAEQRWKSFTVARVADEELLGKIKDKVAEAMDSGLALDEFKNDIDKAFDAVGVSNLNPYHLDTVYLTNTFSGYGEGRKQVIDDLSIDEFPLRQVVTVGDDRVRDEHKLLDGFTAPKDDPVWNWLTTPFSYRCRCEIMPVHISEGLSPSGFMPDVRGRKGFEFLK